MGCFLEKSDLRIGFSAGLLKAFNLTLPFKGLMLTLRNIYHSQPA